MLVMLIELTISANESNESFVNIIQQWQWHNMQTKYCMTRNKIVLQSCAAAKSETFWQATGQSNLAYKWLAATKTSKVFGFHILTALWPVEQSSILSAKFDCPVAYQNILFLAMCMIVKW